MTDNLDIDHGAEPAPARTRAPSRRATGARSRSLPRGQAVGRNGEVISRNIVTGGDQFHIPDTLKEAGWDYQWLTEHILNSADVVRRHNNDMYQAGWRPVLAAKDTRWNGVFGPPSDTGHIRVGDCGLYERPMSLTEEARDEDLRKAKQQMRDRDEALMGGSKGARRALGNGIEMGGKYRGTGGDLRMSIDPALDVDRPSYQAADDEAQ